MLTRPVPQKIRPDHLDRLAVIYVRQSTLFQVRENSGSTTRQYDLVKRAQALGWTAGSHQVVDQDQGQSGASSVGRDGFQWLVAEVGLGHVGAVFSRGASRAWLVRAATGSGCWKSVPSLRRLSLMTKGSMTQESITTACCWAQKGSMSEAELHWLKSRLQGGKQSKAEQGSLRFRLPIGAGLPIQLAGLCLTLMRPCKKPFVWSSRFVSKLPRPSPSLVPLPSSTCAFQRAGGEASGQMN